jgi:hypothetical protein
MRIRTSTIVAALALLAGCGGTAPGLTVAPTTAGSATAASPAAPPTAAPTATPDHSKPVGLIAMGHSGITGEGTGNEGEAAPGNSWATGTLPAVNSVYLRMVTVLPETEGHVANTGQGGAPASRLTTMVVRALQTVPVPALAIIQTIDSDIECDGRDADRLTAFGESVSKAIQLVVDASPNGHVLVVGQLGRPSATFLDELVEAAPGQRAALTGTGPCDFYDPSGGLNEEHLANLTAIIEGFEAEQARVCATFTQCTTDGGVRAAYVDKLENFSSDWNHLNVKGQAAEAELIWPVVEQLLGQ